MNSLWLALESGGNLAGYTVLKDTLFQRLGGLSYFAGAEKKDDRVLVPDLGSLTSVHDR